MCPHGRQHRLADHRLGTVRWAAELASAFGAESWAALAGRWRDWAKRSPEFQKYLERTARAPSSPRPTWTTPRARLTLPLTRSQS